MIVYKLRCIINNKCYIGITTESLAQRWSKHLYKANNGYTAAIANAIRKYGAPNFRREVLYEASSLEELVVVERALIAAHNTLCPNGYNIVVGGDVGFGVPKINAQGIKNCNSQLTEDIVIWLRDPKLAAIPTTRFVEKLNGKFSYTCLIKARRGESWSYLNKEHPPMIAGYGKRSTGRVKNMKELP